MGETRVCVGKIHDNPLEIILDIGTDSHVHLGLGLLLVWWRAS